MPKISVIMGVYNCKSYEMLNDSISSILNQTFEDFEFLICDDGSTNDTFSYLTEIAKTDNRIKVLSYRKNKGLNYALNACLKEASGKYIARQDDDDVSRKDRLEKQFKFLENNEEYAIVGTIAEVIDNNGVWGEYNVPERPQAKDFFWNSPFMHPTVMIKRNAILSVGGYSCSKEARRCEDYDLFMRMYSNGYLGYNIQEKLYSYRLINDPNKKIRPMKYRIDEAIVRYKGYKSLGLLIPGIPFIIKPIIVGLIPQKILYKIKRKVY